MKGFDETRACCGRDLRVCIFSTRLMFIGTKALEPLGEARWRDLVYGFFFSVDHGGRASLSCVVEMCYEVGRVLYINYFRLWRTDLQNIIG